MVRIDSSDISLPIMPELPEVENIVRELRRKIKNKILRDVLVRFSGIVFPVRSFAKELKGRKIVDVKRRLSRNSLTFTAEQDIRAMFAALPLRG